jgi:hypothetical protein
MYRIASCVLLELVFFNKQINSRSRNRDHTARFDSIGRNWFCDVQNPAAGW